MRPPPFRQNMSDTFPKMKLVAKHLAMIMITSSIFKFPIILILLRNLSYGVEISIPFLYIALLNILPQI